MGVLGSLLAFGCSPVVNRMTFFPDRTAPGRVEVCPKRVSEVTVGTEDGERLQCFLVRNTTSSRLLLYFHGNAGNIYQRVYELMQIADCGVNVLGVGYRGYGKSTGRPSERGIYRDGAAALNHAVSQLGYAESAIVVMGRSLGTTVAVRTAAGRDLAGLILVTPLSTGKAYARAHGLGAIAFLAGNAFDNIEAARQLRCRTLVIHGTSDEMVPYWMGRELYDSLQVPKQFVEIPNGFHNTLESDSGMLYWDMLRTFLAPAPHEG